MERMCKDPNRIQNKFSTFFSAYIGAVIGVLFTFTFSQTSYGNEAPGNLVYQGRIIKPDGNPLEVSNVLFSVGVYSADGTCLLYAETHTLNMSSSNGFFSITLGSGTPTGPAYSLKEVFSNISSFTGGGGCNYSPATEHSRKVKVSFDDGGGPVALQDQTVQSIPYALYASKLEGMGKNDFLQINTSTSSLSQANANNLFQNATYNELMALAGGTSTQFAKASDLPVASGVLNLSGAGQGVRVLDVPGGGDYAVNKNYTDQYVGGKAVDAANFSGLSNGESIKWDSTANSGLGGWIRYTPVSLSGLVTNGGQAGSVSLGSSDANALSLLTNGISRLTVSSTGNVGIGTANPNSTLQVQGSIVSSAVDVPTGAVADLSTSNTITLDSVGGSTISLSNMIHGGTYTLVIKDTTSRTYTFSGCNTSKFKPVNGSTLAGAWSVYTILALYNGATYDCVITWATGYQ